MQLQINHFAYYSFHFYKILRKLLLPSNIWEKRGSNVTSVILRVEHFAGSNVRELTRISLISQN